MKNQTLKEFFKYVSANVIAMIGLSCYILADTFFISLSLGKTGLASLNLAMPSFSIVFSIGLMFGIGGSTKFAIYKGAGDVKSANRVFTHTVFVVACFAVVFVLLGAFLSGPVASFLGADGKTFSGSKTYVQIILCFAPFFMFNNVLQNFIRNDGAPRLAMTASLLGNLFNIVFDYVFIFPCKLGMLGAALATGISPVISMLILMIFFFRKKNTFRLEKTKLSLRVFGEIISLGLASFIAEFGFGLVMMLINKLFKSLGGDTAVAAFAIVVNVYYVINAIFNGISLGTQPIISFSYGQHDFTRIRQVLKYALITIGATAAVLYVILFFSADGIAAIFNTEKAEDLQTCHDRHKTVFHFFAVFGIQSVIFVILFGVRQWRMFANHHPSARSRADYSACLSFRTSLENHGALARNARRRNADARCGDYHILCHTQKTRRRGNPRPRFGTGIIRRTRSPFSDFIFSFLLFSVFDGNDKYYRRDNNQPDARGQYYDDFGHLSERRLVPFGIFRRAKEKREIAVGQFQNAPRKPRRPLRSRRFPPLR
ncbi:MAG: MATE family efflux transporter [Clostridiales bacterium]|nr:MAG: MATE family efflux transporter [Clostridiales bacterium]